LLTHRPAISRKNADSHVGRGGISALGPRGSQRGQLRRLAQNAAFPNNRRGGHEKNQWVEKEVKNPQAGL